ncbi:MAG: DUF3866 family protein [Actinomycetota bacterium]
MAAFREGKIASILSERHDLVRATVATEEGEIEAAGFTSMLGPLKTGDRVIVNTTGVELELGTGGVGFILWNLDGPGPGGPGEGHIVKLRYTPWQTEVLAAEAPESRHHDSLRAVDSIDGMPVVVCSLHSQIAAVAAGVKAAAPDARVGYLMTDGAALPIAWSDLVDELKKAGLLDVTCTAGHAFGGDLESVNVFSGLVALRAAGEVDAAVAAMGPGVVGTSSALGFTGMEQGQILDAATALGGRAIACLRVNFADARPRHRGLSHHTLTALRIAARERCTVAVPELEDDRLQDITAALDDAGISRRHDVVTADGRPGIEAMRDRGVTPTSMGRSLDEVPELFLAGAAAGALAASWL